MTAHALLKQKKGKMPAGRDEYDYLAKPFKEPDLLDKIAHWAASSTNNPAADKPTRYINMIDLSFLVRQRGTTGLHHEMINIFKNQNPRDIAKLKTAIGKEDLKAIYKTIPRNTIGFFGLTLHHWQRTVDMMKLQRDMKTRNRSGSCLRR